MGTAYTGIRRKQMTRREVSKAELDEFTKKAGGQVTTLETDFGTWAAIAIVGGQDYVVETEALNPEAPGYIEDVSQAKANKMITTNYRTRSRW